MLAVLLVLMALLFILAPFLATVNNAERTAARRSNETAANLALDNAARLGKARLAASHRAWDATPYSDSAEELAVRNDLDPTFADMNGARWDLDVEDLSGRIDLDSAPPAMIANLLGTTTRLTEFLTEEDTTLHVASTNGFPDEGVIWVAGELVRYAKLTPTTFEELTRGLGAEEDDGEVLPGPLPPVDAAAGTAVLDQRALALAQWRIAGVGEGDEVGGRRDPRQFGSPDRLAQVGDFVLLGDWGADVVAPLLDLGTVHGAWGAGPQWLTASRIQHAILGGETMTLDVAEPRWFGPGTTIRIHGTGVSEFAIVRAVSPRNGRLYLDRPLINDHNAFEAVAEPMARRPVNVNTASADVLEALFANVRLSGRNSRITQAEAKQIAEVILESRPFDGFQDFVERLIYPAAGMQPLPADAPVVPEVFADGGTFLSREDALAVYRNALMPNDIALEVSTMPLCFTSRDVYRFELRASVTAESGVERLERVREEVHAVVPQDELLELFVSQEDFDEELRLSRQAAGWNTGPFPTTRFDNFLKADPAPRFRAHLGSQASIAEPAAEDVPFPGQFAEREAEGYVQLLPSRISDAGIYAGHTLHFDWEEESNQGRNVAERPLEFNTTNPRLGWTNPNTTGMLRPLHFSAWVRPRTAGGYLLDVVGNSQEADRVKLFVEGSDLVLQVLDGAGDHPDSLFEEIAEVRYPLDTAPGLPNDVWSHVLVDVRGNRPDQMLLMVDQRPAPKTPGMTRLSQALASTSGTIAVESTDGFPDKCVLKIGRELIEAQVQGPQSFIAQHIEVGPDAGFGGRLARERFSAPGDQLPWVNEGLVKNTNYGVGTTVELYGYSAPLVAAASNGYGNLPSPLGPFAVARAAGAIGGDSSDGDEIYWQSTLFPNPIKLGTGLEGAGTGATGIRLEAADVGRPINEVMRAFSPSGGYAVLVQLAGGVRIGTESTEFTINGTNLYRQEVIHYSGWNNDELYIDKRGGACGELSRLTGTGLLEDRAFIFNWEPDFNEAGSGQALNTIASWQTFVVPISLPAMVATGTFGFPQPAPGRSEYAQFTRPDNAEFTEWVRYDEVANGELVRDDPLAMALLATALSSGGGGGDVNPLPTGGGGTPPTPGSGSSGGGFGSPIFESKTWSPPTASAALVGSYWDHEIGDEENTQWPLSRAIATQFQFRGVMGTFSHDQPVGTLVLPVFRLLDTGFHGGLPGRNDKSFLMDADPASPGWPVTVHRAYRPRQYQTTSWVNAPSSGATPFQVAPGPGAIEPDLEIATGNVFVAMQARLPIPIAPGFATPSPGTTVVDIRETARLTKFPSGERPRLVDTAWIGAENVGGSNADATVDEAAFLSSDFGAVVGGDSTLGGGIVLTQPAAATASTLFISPNQLRMPSGMLPSSTPLLTQLPNDAGLLRIGDEIVCYSDLDPSSGEITIAPGGRGMLGTEQREHAAGVIVQFLEFFPVSQLAVGVGADDAELTLEDATDFAADGLVRIEEELIHHTRTQSSVLIMPRASETPGERDASGAGIYRARFGTDANAHPQGVPVVGHPFRYWDRFTLRSDAPELHYFGFNSSEPNAYWKTAFWNAKYDRGGPWIGMLVRTDPSIPWDADPVETEGLYLIDGGRMEAGGNPLGFQSDRIEARLFQSFRRGAYDVLDGLNHGWKLGPEVSAVGFEFLAPGAVLERVWK